MGHFKFRILYSLIFFWGITGIVTGQNANSVKKLDLIGPFINADQVHLQQDADQNLWITTPVKIMRYNSNTLVDFNKFRGIPKEIGRQYIATYTDSSNKIWLAGNEGLAVFDRKQDKFRFVSEVPGKIYALREDESNQLWIAAENGIFKLKVDSSKPDFGLSRFLSENTMASDIALYRDLAVFGGPNGILTINRRSGKFDKIDMGYYQNLKITCFLPLNDNILFGTSENGLYSIDRDFRKINKIYSLPYSIAKKPITSLHKIGEEIIVGTRGEGVLKLDENLKFIQNDKSKYPESIYTSLLNDQNLFYIVANEGVFIQNLSGMAVRKLMHDPGKYSSPGHDLITASAKDKNGKIWFGNANGLSIWDPGTNRWQHIKNLSYTKNFNNPDQISDIVSVGDHIWIATLNDAVYKINIHSLKRAHYSPDALYKTKIRSATSLFVDGRENIWIGGKSGYLSCIRTNNQIKNYPIKDVQAIGELGPKKLIVATSNRVHSLDPSSGRITDLPLLSADEELLYYSINDLKITNDGTGLFATEGSGLLIYDFEKEQLEILNIENGIPSNNIVAVEPTMDNGLWITTSNGLAYFDRDEKSVRIFTELNGLSTNELTTGLEELEDGSLVLGSSKGINIFKPKSMLAQNDFKPDLKLLKANLKGKKAGKAEEVILADIQELKLSDEANLQLSFIGLSQLNPDEVVYSWKMEGYDEEWSRPASLTSVNYSGLPPGSYVFKLRAKLKNASWTEPLELRLQVEETGGTVNAVYMFMGISVIAMLGIFVFVFRKRSKNADLMAKAELRNQLEKEFRKPVENAVKSLSKVTSETDLKNSEDLQRFAARFDELFHQILNFNYKESAFEISRINLHQHLPQVLNEIEPVYRSKELEIIVNDQWGESDFFYNMEMLDKIFFSLISGSAGYSFKGGKIIVNLIETGVGDLKLQITDNGRGIPSQDIKSLERNKVDREGLRRDKSGLKYIIKARDLIGSCGGSFSFETEKDEGSTFTAILKNRKEDYRKVPQRAAAIFKSEKAKTTSADELPSELKNLSESKILIISDGTENRTLLVNTIGKYCQVYQAETAEEGIEKAGMIFPDIIIADAVLPDMNGIQLSKMLKRNLALDHIDLFLIADGQNANFGETEGVSQVIAQPLEIISVMKKLTEVLLWQKKLRLGYVQNHKNSEEIRFRSPKAENFILKLKEIIVENIDNENFSVHDLSAAMNLSSNALFMKLKNLIGLSPQDFMEFTRLNYATKLLEKGELNQMEVAYRSGFSSPTLFNNSYRKFYGYSYSESLENKPDQ